MAEIVFLSSPQTLGAKRLTPLEETDIDCACGFGPFAVHVFNVRALDELSAGLQSCPSNAFMVRGDPRGQREIPYRRKDPRKNEFTGAQEHATLFSCAREIVQIDIDAKHLDIPKKFGLVERLNYALEHLLPWWFRGVSVLVQATSSCRHKSGLRIRLWYIADRPVSDEECIAVFEACGADVSIYQPHGLIYVCNPTFDGVADPFAGESRWLLVPGNVDVLPWHGPEPRTPKVQDYPRNEEGGEGRLIPEGNRHNELIRYQGQLARRGLPVAVVRDMVSTFNRTALAVPLNETEMERTIYPAIPGWVASAPELEPPPPQDYVRVTDVSEKALKKALERVAGKKGDPANWRGECERLAPFVKTRQLDISHVVRALYEAGVGAQRDEIQAELEKQMLFAASQPEKLARANAMRGVLADVMDDLRISPDTGAIVPTADNVWKILHSNAFELWVDSRSGDVMIERAPWVKGRRKLTDGEGIECGAWLCDACGWAAVPGPSAHEVMRRVASERTRDLWREFLESLRGQWDGVCRFRDASARLLGADSERERTCFAWWMISAVARTMRPGCQVDHVIVLEGAQGIGKTTFLRELVGEQNYRRMPGELDASNPRVIGRLRGGVIIELAELSALRRSQVEQVKEFLDATSDTWQPLYARETRTDPRTCVFAGTTNSDEYLNDPTGARRFWPIACTRIDLDALRAERVQLWAEAVAKFDAGQAWWPSNEQATTLQLAQATEERREVPEHVDEVDTVLDTPASDTFALKLEDWQRMDGVVVAVALGQLKQRIKAKDRELGRALWYLGWRKVDGQCRANGKKWRLWVRCGWKWEPGKSVGLENTERSGQVVKH